jgi:GNAT superfamily N-acetyltransferase
MNAQLSSNLSKATAVLEVIYKTLCADDPDDVDAFIDIRIKALTGSDRRFFTADPGKELGRSRDEWRDACMETCDQAVMGAAIGKQLIGMMTVTRLEDDVTGKTAYYGAAYVLEQFRGTEVPKKLIQRLDQWAIDHGCDKAVFTIKSEKKEWIEKQRKHGARIVKVLRMPFADGSEAPIYLLERPLTASYARRSVQEEPVARAG